jgi:hypothetical protein
VKELDLPSFEKCTQLTKFTISGTRSSENVPITPVFTNGFPTMPPSLDEFSLSYQEHSPILLVGRLNQSHVFDLVDKFKHVQKLTKYFGMSYFGGALKSIHCFRFLADLVLEYFTGCL